MNPPLVELVDQGLEPAFAVLFADRVVQGLPVGGLDALAFAVGELGVEVPGSGAHSTAAGLTPAAGTICTGDMYGGGWVHALFTRRPWRKRGVGAALLTNSFGRFWERGEHSVGLGVDAASDSGAFRLYERAGMAPLLGWVTYEKQLGDAA